MHVERAVDMAAEPAAIYDLVEDVARWPALLPHYRAVHVLRQSSHERVVVMSARRDWIPVTWKAVQRLYPAVPRLEFEHLSGWTKGMQVAWTFCPIDGGTRVTIEHDVTFHKAPFAREWIGRRVVGEFFIQSIAGRTLACFKRIVEGNRG